MLEPINTEKTTAHIENSGFIDTPLSTVSNIQTSTSSIERKIKELSVDSRSYAPHYDSSDSMIFALIFSQMSALPAVAVGGLGLFIPSLEIVGECLGIAFLTAGLGSIPLVRASLRYDGNPKKKFSRRLAKLFPSKSYQKWIKEVDNLNQQDSDNKLWVSMLKQELENRKANQLTMKLLE